MNDVTNAEKKLPMDLSDTSWEQIGEQPEAVLLGAFKPIVRKSGKVGVLVAIGFNHDDRADGQGKANITWEFRDYLPELMCMNEEWTNRGGWGASDARRRLNSEILEDLPDELRAIMTMVRKETSVDGCQGKGQITEDFLFLKSEQETFGRVIYSKFPEGMWYELYKQEGFSYAKRGANGDRGWGLLRSPDGSYSNVFCAVASSGGAANYYASGAAGVAPGLCTIRVSPSAT